MRTFWRLVTFLRHRVGPRKLVPSGPSTGCRPALIARPSGFDAWAMDEPLTEAPRGRVPHHGPVTWDCPVECLLTVLSINSFNPLARADGAPRADAQPQSCAVPLAHLQRPATLARSEGCAKWSGKCSKVIMGT